MARASTKCADCGDILYFDSIHPPPQAVQCPCNATRLTEDGPVGNFTQLTQEEEDALPP